MSGGAITVEELRRISVEPGDVFVLQPHPPRGWQARQEVSKAWREVFPANNLIILAPDDRLTVVRAKDAEAHAAALGEIIDRQERRGDQGT